MTRPIQRGDDYDDGRVVLRPKGETAPEAHAVPGEPAEAGRSDSMATMTVSHNKLVGALNDLIALDFDAIAAYEAAIDRLKDVRDKNQLTAFMDDHRRHTRDLSAVVRNLGGEPRTGADVKQVLTKGKVVIAGLSGDDAVLRAMKSNEDTTNREYEKSLSLEGLTPSIRDVLERNLGDERRHREWIEQRIGEYGARSSHAPVR